MTTEPIIKFVDHIGDVILGEHDGHTFIINANDAELTKDFSILTHDKYIVGWWTSGSDTLPIIKNSLYGRYVIQLCECLHSK